MSKFDLRLKARKLRLKGFGIRHIASNLKISKSSASRWCSDIVLTPKQIEILSKRKENGVRMGQLKGAKVLRDRKMEKIKNFKREGSLIFSNLSEREFFVSGVALYLAEGSKGYNKVAFTNSNPKLILFMMRWFSKFFNVSGDRFIVSILVNKIHRDREDEIKNFWSGYLGIPLSQFRKTFFVTSKQQKIYSNHNNHFGTLNLRILKSTDILYKIAGLSDGLLESNLEI